MRRIISRSVILMFLFDMLAIASASYFSYRYFGLPQRFHIPTVVLTTVLGAIVLYLKSQYKIREFNVTKRNYYLLFEGVIFFNIVPFALLFFFVPKMSLVCYYALTMLIVGQPKFKFWTPKLSLDSQNENCRTQNANISILRLVRGKYSNFVCHTF